MAITRPIVLVYQEYTTVTTAPQAPDLNCLIVGPCYFIQDYPDDAATIGEGAFVKTTFTKDAPCAHDDGSSMGRPDAGVPFLDLDEPPNISAAPGALLDADSVEVVFDEVQLEIYKGIDGAISANDNTLTSAGSTFTTAGILPGDRIVLTKHMDSPTVTFTVVKLVKAVLTATTLTVTSTFKQADVDTNLGATDIRFRVEHQLNDQVVDDAYVSVSDQEIIIHTLADGLKFAYNDTTYPANYAAAIYVGYRALRQDIQDVLTLDNSAAIATSKVGRVDERNPLAVGAFVAFQNTGTPVQVFGVVSDDLDGQTSAKDHVTSRDDIYAIVPVTGKPSGVVPITEIDWIGVITMWKGHCYDYSQPEKSKFRVVIGSYDTLPTERATAPASTTGYTVVDPTETNHSVFVDPSVYTDFVADEVSSSHLLDVTKGHADLITLAAQKTIFWAGTTPYWTGSTSNGKELQGVMGKKRIRVATAAAFTAAKLNETCAYAIREPILKAEGAPSAGIYADAAGAAWFGIITIACVDDKTYTPCINTDIGKPVAATGSGDTGTLFAYNNTTKVWVVVPDTASDDFAPADILVVTGGTGGAVVTTATPTARITSNGAFENAQAGDVASVSEGATSAHNDGFVITAATDDYIDIQCASIVIDTVTVQVYRPVASMALAKISGSAHKIYVASGNPFANVQAGDMAFILQTTTAGNLGMWIVSSKSDSNNVVLALPTGFGMADELAGVTNVVFFRSVSSNGAATVTSRKRLTRLRDDTGPFGSPCAVGDNIEIPYPENVDPTKWDTSTTHWPIKTISSDEIVDASLTALQELAPELFVAGFNGDCAYRVTIGLDKTAQVKELNTIPTGLKSLGGNRCVMTWPNEVYVSTVINEKTGVKSKQTGQYLACAVGGMTAGLPSHQGFTFIGIGGIQQIFNSNFYFTDGQIDTLSEGGWYVFLQDSESSTPYSAHEVTTDTDSYEMGEYMNVKNFDFIATFYKNIMKTFLGRYNITNETKGMLGKAFNDGTDFLKRRVFPRIGAPLLDAAIISLKQLADEVDRVEIYATVNLPKVLNKIGLHLQA